MKAEESVRTLSGVGPKRAEALARQGITTLGDLLHFYPQKYLNRARMGSLTEENELPVTIRVVVTKKGTLRRIRRNMSLFVLPVEEVQDGGHVQKGEILWFNQPYLGNVFTVDEAYLFFGKVTLKNGRYQMMNPQFVHESKADSFLGVTPVYSRIEGVPDETLKKYIRSILASDYVVVDHLPERYRQKYHFPSSEDALRLIHEPKTEEDVEKGKLRLKFDEALKINMGILSSRHTCGASKIILEDYDVSRRFISSLPFQLTESQKAVLSDISEDLKKGVVMNRLVQGDVGSGKTIIAVACACLFALNGYQSAYMAPTEILAEQHAQNFKNYLEPFGIQVVLLTGGLKGKAREAVEKSIRIGEAQVVIGTHALIQDRIDYYNLGMVITDEQHRFGVKQRGRLSLKGELPHTLVMSATPIPRTLALILYGDLDVSYIDELPKGRKPIKTYFYREKALPKILKFMGEEMEKGRQSFVICPFIEESEEMCDVKDIQTVFSEVSDFYQGRFRTACLYGRMKSDEKQQIIADFNAGLIDQLVATSIIEVGIDVPNVSVITILSADRFGLSQLHQLRGRTGRGQYQSYCFLVSNTKNDQTIERMRVIVENTEGRAIADEDYRLRGPGDYFGLKQHGFPAFKTLNPYDDYDLIVETRDVAAEIFESREEELMCYRAEITEAFHQDVMEISLT